MQLALTSVAESRREMAPDVDVAFRATRGPQCVSSAPARIRRVRLRDARAPSLAREGRCNSRRRSRRYSRPDLPATRRARYVRAARPVRNRRVSRKSPVHSRSGRYRRPRPARYSPPGFRVRGRNRVAQWGVPFVARNSGIVRPERRRRRTRGPLSSGYGPCRRSARTPRLVHRSTAAYAIEHEPGRRPTHRLTPNDGRAVRSC